jgi:hypothetical protein
VKAAAAPIVPGRSERRYGRRMRACRPQTTVLAVVAAMLAGAATAQESGAPALETGQSYVEEVLRPTELAIDDPLAVFAFVLNSLPERVAVYPTENYYYFSFVHNGVPYSGNIRIQIEEDDAASLHFAYYQTETPWHPDENAKLLDLSPTHGVRLEKVDRLLYRVSYQSKSVLFALNDLSGAKPPAGALAPDERFIGPIFDESGVRFFLVYNPKLKIFLYLLDEAAKPTEELFGYVPAARILVGKRTGFAYYRDHLIDRKILIGVQEDNLRLNTYFDGPFDQLPDNFIEGESLRSAILDASPEFKGKIDRFGRMHGGKFRYSIKPYAPYLELRELEVIDQCAKRSVRAMVYYRCFVASEYRGTRRR